MNPRSRFKRVLEVLFIALIIIFAVTLIKPDAFGFMSRMFSDDNSINLNNRDIIWYIAIEKFLEKPLFGIGINQFDIYFNEYFLEAYSYYNYTYFAGAHNSYLQFLSEVGIFAIVFYLFFLGYLFQTFKCIKQIKMSNNRTIMMFSFSIQLLTLIYALSGNPMHQYQQLFMYMIAVGIVVGIKNSQLAVFKKRRINYDYFVRRDIRSI